MVIARNRTELLLLLILLGELFAGGLDLIQLLVRARSKAATGEGAEESRHSSEAGLLTQRLVLSQVADAPSSANEFA